MYLNYIDIHYYMATQNKFNTTPNGTTTININSILNLPTTLIIDSARTPYIDNIINNNPNIIDFVFNPGTYKLVNIFKILKNGIHFIGKTGNPVDVQILVILFYKIYL